MAGNRNSGRRPAPTAIKKVLGFPPGRINEHEPTPPAGPVEQPDGLSVAAQAVWETLAPVCVAMGTLTSADTVAFATLCELEATRRRTSAEKDRPDFSPFLMSAFVDGAGTEHVTIKEHPAIKLERNTAAAMRPYFEKFGLEPSGRSRIKVAKPEAVNKWAAMGL